MQFLTKSIALDGYGEDHAAEVIASSCWHQDSRGFCPQAFKKMAEYACKPQVRSFLYLGDANDNARSTIQAELDKIDSIGGSESWRRDSDTRARMRIAETEERAGPFRDKIHVWLLGNHGWKLKTFPDGERTHATEDGKTIHAPHRWTDEVIADELGATFAEGVAIVRYDLFVKGRKHSPESIHFGMRHGMRGGTTETGDQNSLIREMEQYTNVDVWIAGHTHHLYVKKLRAKMEITRSGRRQARRRHIARAGSMDRNLLDGSEASYGEKRGLPPTGIGYVMFKLWLERARSGGTDYVDLNIAGMAKEYT